MKKFLCWMVLALLSMNAQAFIGERLDISIANQTEADCVLKDSLLLHGHVSDHTSIPEVIFRGQTGKFSLRPKKKSSMWERDKSPVSMGLLLTYACGDGHSIRLLNERSATRVYVFPQVFASENMKARHLSNDGAGFVKPPAKIDWTIRWS